MSKKKRKKSLKGKTNSERLKEFLTSQGKIFAEDLKQKATEYEKILYKILKELKYNFKFQEPFIVPVGKSYKLYIVDFLLTDYNIFIECDGNFHQTPINKKKDNLRTKHLSKIGLYPIRFTNGQISSFNKANIDNIIRTKISLISQVVKKL